MKPEAKFPLFIYPNYWCNYSCSYCFTNSNEKQDRSTYVIDNWLAIVRDASRSGITEFRISGGEPLSIPNFNEMLCILKAHNMKYTLTTNGVYFRKIKEQLIDYKPEQLWLSYHPEHISLNSWLSLASTISKTLSMSIGANIFTCDIKEFGFEFDKLKQAGVCDVKLLEKTPIGRNQNNTINKPTIEQYKKIITSSQFHGVNCRIEGVLAYDDNVGINSCVLKHRLLLSVAPDGKVYPCCVVVGNEQSELGSIQHNSFEKILTLYFQNRKLPCENLLPNITSGQAKCPLVLDTVDKLKARIY